MAIMNDPRDDSRVTPADVPAAAIAEYSIEVRRARRMAALKKIAGIWAQRQDIPADGLEYLREVRSD